MADLNSFFAKLLPSAKRAPKVQQGVSPTYSASNQTGVLSAPQYRDFQKDLLDERSSLDSRGLLKRLFKHDSDLSAAVAAYLTMADVKPIIYGYDDTGMLNPAISQMAQQILRVLNNVSDYSLGFDSMQGFELFQQELRYMVMLRGAIGVELVLGQNYVPSHLEQVDMASIEWIEKASGQFKPRQVPLTGAKIDLDIPTFVVGYHRRDPTTPYPESDFVSAINTITARQQVINDLYRIMQVVGFPRIHVSVLEEVVRKNLPPAVAASSEDSAAWMNARLSEVANSFSAIRADQPIVHWNSSEISILNKDNPGASLQVSEVINTLNAQNQAATKTVSTVLGRGTSNINTASVESRLFVRGADQINKPLAQVLGRLLTLCIHLQGQAGYVVVEYPPAEMRPELELEPSKVIRASRLKQDLSLGIITDSEYTMQMYGRTPHPEAPVLSGTNFLSQDSVSVDTSNLSPNQGSLERDLTDPSTNPAKSDQNKQA